MNIRINSDKEISKNIFEGNSYKTRIKANYYYYQKGTRKSLLNLRKEYFSSLYDEVWCNLPPCIIVHCIPFCSLLLKIRIFYIDNFLSFSWSLISINSILEKWKACLIFERNGFHLAWCFLKCFNSPLKLLVSLNTHTHTIQIHDWNNQKHIQTRTYIHRHTHDTHALKETHWQRQIKSHVHKCKQLCIYVHEFKQLQQINI